MTAATAAGNAWRRFVPSKNFLMQAIGAGILSASGDTISQLFVDRVERYNPWRTARFAAVTCFLIVPIQFRWFLFLEKFFKGDRSLKTSLKKLVMDQSLIAPTLTGLFLSTVNTLNARGSLEEGLRKTRAIYLDVMTANYKIWPAVQLVNFTLIPLQFRVVFLQFFALFWNIYLSTKTMGGGQKMPPDEEYQAIVEGKEDAKITEWSEAEKRADEGKQKVIEAKGQQQQKEYI